MERHLNKSKYGCPANRFSGGSGAANLSGDLSESDLSNGVEGPVSLVQSVSSGAVSVSLPHDSATLVTLLPSHLNTSNH